MGGVGLFDESLCTFLKLKFDFSNNNSCMFCEFNCVHK